MAATRRFCKHEKYKVIDNIWEPKYSTDEVLINVERVPEDYEHFIIKFKKCNRFHKQKNGGGMVYCVPMSRRETFEPIKENCGHDA